MVRIELEGVCSGSGMTLLGVAYRAGELVLLARALTGSIVRAVGLDNVMFVRIVADDSCYPASSVVGDTGFASVPVLRGKKRV